MIIIYWLVLTAEPDSCFLKHNNLMHKRSTRDFKEIICELLFKKKTVSVTDERLSMVCVSWETVIHAHKQLHT